MSNCIMKMFTAVMLLYVTRYYATCCVIPTGYNLKAMVVSNKQLEMSSSQKFIYILIPQYR